MTTSKSPPTSSPFKGNISNQTSLLCASVSRPVSATLSSLLHQISDVSSQLNFGHHHHLGGSLGLLYTLSSLSNPLLLDFLIIGGSHDSIWSGLRLFISRRPWWERRHGCQNQIKCFSFPNLFFFPRVCVCVCVLMCALCICVRFPDRYHLFQTGTLLSINTCKTVYRPGEYMNIVTLTA